MSLKDIGNEHFKAGDYKSAEILYSQACASQEDGAAHHN